MTLNNRDQKYKQGRIKCHLINYKNRKEGIKEWPKGATHVKKGINKNVLSQSYVFIERENRW